MEKLKYHSETKKNTEKIKKIQKQTSEKLSEFKLGHYLEKQLSGEFKTKIFGNIKHLENNREGMIELYENLNSTIKFSLNIINEKFPEISNSKISRTAIMIFITWIQKAGLTTAHEVAHANKAKAYGYHPSVGYQKGTNLKGKNNVYELFISQIFRKGRAYTEFINNIEYLKNEDSLDISGAGPNLNSEIAENHIENSIYNNNGSLDIVDSTSYLYNKNFLFGYILYSKGISDDPIAVIKNLNETLGTNYTLDDLKKYAVLSLFSGGVLTALKEGYDFIFNDKYHTELLGFKTPFGKVYLPEFQTYLNKNNISVKISNYIRLNNGDIIKLAFEKNVMGKKGTEITLGGKHNINKKIFVYGEATIGNKGNYVKGGVNFQTNNDLGFFIEGEVANGETNIGNRRVNGGKRIKAGFKFNF